MNRTSRSILAALAVAGALVASIPAQADEGLATRVATGVGRAIAEQGNAALKTIREEIKDTLADTLAPFLPADHESDDAQDPAAPAA